MISKIFQNKYIVIGILAVVLISLILISTVFQKNNINVPILNPKPTEIISKDIVLENILTIDKIPTIPESEGYGLDAESTEIKNSVSEIQKLQNSLPFQKTFTSSTGKEIEIYLPDNKLSENKWTQTVHIFGIDYQIEENDEKYESERKSFQESAEIVFSYLKSNGVLPEKVLVQWGDRSFIQDRSRLWLSSID